jgi:hypothetical protein
VDFWKDIFFNRNLKLFQRIIIAITTFGYVCAPFVVIMAITGQLGWVTGTPKPFEFADFIKFISVFLFTSGFTIASVYSLRKEKLGKEIFNVVFAALTIGIILAISNSIAFIRALLGLKTPWFLTPKWGSVKILELFKRFTNRI